MIDVPVEPPANPPRPLVVEIVALRPLAGIGTPLRDIPATVQSLDGDGLNERRPRDLAEDIGRRFAGTHLNDGTGNPFQQDLSYRGFTASPLLGLPQGLSVFVDGVRVNEPFGDMVNWDLIPPNAVAGAHLLSGSNPVFGLNTLGGALAIQTKSGAAFPGSAFQFSSGSFGRRTAEAETGGQSGPSDYFAAIRLHDEDGWREHSPSALHQGFFKLGWQDARTDIDVSLALAQNRFQGTQALPLSMLGDPRQPYTWPDRTENQLGFLTARASRELGEGALVSASFYLRRLQQDTVSSNVNGDFDPALGNPQGFNDRGTLEQNSAGVALQLVQRHGRHEITFGGALDGASATFAQDRQDAAFSADREAVGTSAFEPTVRLDTHNTHRALYAMDRVSLSEHWTLTLAGRYDVAQVSLRDRSGERPALDGDHRFNRFNPAIGVNWNPIGALTWFASASQGMRVPSPVELTCADPHAPCSLPNQFLADPALKPVRARTVETGARWNPSGALRLSASAYRTVLSDDIQFISAGASTTAGYFQNTGGTVREGLELTGQAKASSFTAGAAYGYIRARYQSDFTMRSPNNSSRDANDEIQVEAGNRIPGIPRSSLKLFLDWPPLPEASVGLNWAWFGRQYARGDENNRDVNGPLPSYGVAQLIARYRPRRDWQLAMTVDNLFDKDYSSFGLLGRNFFGGPGNQFDAASAAPELFVTRGAPRAVWLSIRYAMGVRPRS